MKMFYRKNNTNSLHIYGNTFSRWNSMGQRAHAVSSEEYVGCYPEQPAVSPIIASTLVLFEFEDLITWQHPTKFVGCLYITLCPCLMSRVCKLLLLHKTCVLQLQTYYTHTCIHTYILVDCLEQYTYHLVCMWVTSHVIVTVLSHCFLRMAGLPLDGPLSWIILKL